MRCIELPIDGDPVVRRVALDAAATEYVEIVRWRNDVALCVAKSRAPISPTRQLNPHAPWMQGVGHLMLRDLVTKTSLPIETVDNAMECLHRFNEMMHEVQHNYMFPGSNGALVNRTECALMTAAARTKFVDVDQNDA